MSRAYYNEFDPAAAHVLRQLIADGVIAPGDVDERSIKEVQPDDLRGYTQCHFFAGGGLWSVAARLAGWPDERPLWTGSCPCQPFSQAGKGLGTDDPRHLWPDFHRLIRACRPPVVMGEQVAGAAGYGWFDGVRADLAVEGYASRCVDIPALAVDAPHERNRLYWCATDVGMADRNASRFYGQRSGAAFGTQGALQGEGAKRERVWPDSRQHDVVGRLGDGLISGLEGYAGHGDGAAGRAQPHRPASSADGRNGTFWSDAEWIICHDGKARRAFAGVSGLAYGLPGMLANLGNDRFVDTQEEIAAYADATQSRPAEVLRTLRDGVLQACTKKASGSGRRASDRLGSTEGFCASEVLLHFLCEYDRRTDGGRGLLSVDPPKGRAVRGVRGSVKSALPPCGREHFQQRPGQPADSLRELSHFLARHAEEAGQAVGSSDAQGMGLLIPSFPGRVDLWRIAGNAISPVLAAEVIAALLDAEADEHLRLTRHAAE